MVDEALMGGEIREDFDKGFVIRILKFTLMHFVDIYPDAKNFIVEDSES